eukprot:TRINITY_DN3311_c0_g1_i2.p1 TRINITY_DN3311_c0_g1~~TRINITY_DN3311_c0_g1_i2.p1  ORF type:complete len:257 (-),score=67.45 TRINITY_DN3311_c0_g1_i2:53-787(-)
MAEEAHDVIAKLKHEVDTKGFVLIDGGLATELERKGCDLHHHLWSAKVLFENPLLIKQVHADYLKAGVDIITTSSYQASIDGFVRCGFTTDEAQQLLIKSSTLAHEAVAEHQQRSQEQQDQSPKPLVGVSVGCYGATLADGSEYSASYIDNISANELKQFHINRIEMMLKAPSGSFDLFVMETLPSVVEAKLLIELLEEHKATHGGDLPFTLSFSCKDNKHVSDGTLLSSAIDSITEVTLISSS